MTPEQIINTAIVTLFIGTVCFLVKWSSKKNAEGRDILNNVGDEQNNLP